VLRSARSARLVKKKLIFLNNESYRHFLKYFLKLSGGKKGRTGGLTLPWGGGGVIQAALIRLKTPSYLRHIFKDRKLLYVDRDRRLRKKCITCDTCCAQSLILRSILCMSIQCSLWDEIKLVLPDECSIIYYVDTGFWSLRLYLQGSNQDGNGLTALESYGNLGPFCGYCFRVKRRQSLYNGIPYWKNQFQLVRMYWSESRMKYSRAGSRQPWTFQKHFNILLSKLDRMTTLVAIHWRCSLDNYVWNISLSADLLWDRRLRNSVRIRLAHCGRCPIWLPLF